MLRAFSLRDDRQSPKDVKKKEPKPSRTRAWIDSMTGGKNGDDDEDDDADDDYVSLVDVRQRMHYNHHHHCSRSHQRSSYGNARRRSLVVLDVPADATLVLRQDSKRRSVQMQTMTDPEAIRHMLGKLFLEHNDKAQPPASPASVARSHRSYSTQHPPHMTPTSSSLRSPLVSLKKDLIRKHPHPLAREHVAAVGDAPRWYRDSDSSDSNSCTSSAGSSTGGRFQRNQINPLADNLGRGSVGDDRNRWIH